LEDILYLYLPIAEIRINLLLLIGIGLFVGTLAGMFGLGGGIIAVPLLAALQIPPSVAVATATNQMTAASFSGYLAYARRGCVDYKLGAFLILGGIIGSSLGMMILKRLIELGRADSFISLSFMIFLTVTCFLTLKDIIVTTYYQIKKTNPPKPRPTALMRLTLPIKANFVSAKREISIFAPILIGLVGGIFVAFMGIGGSLVMIPAMLYVLRVSEKFTAGTSHLQIIFTTIICTIMHALTSKNLDIILSVILIIGTVIGAQIGAILAKNIRQDIMRILFAVVILLLSINVGYNLLTEPDCMYEFEVLKK
jgi:uncharacterized membrane protein YfcA